MSEDKKRSEAAALEASEAKAKSDAEAKAKTDAEAKKQKFAYEVAPGKSVTSKKGLLAEGEEVKPEYFGGGKDDLTRLIKLKVVVKN